MRIHPAGLLITFVYLSTASSATMLRGTIDNMVYGKEGNPYIIDSTITVPKGGKIVFTEGCVVLVNAFCGIDVHGNFIVRGSLKMPVVFTTVNDNHYNPRSETFPQALDWNGITFQLTSDTVFMENFKLMYSVYGIKSWNSKIVLHNGIFGENGQYDVVVNDALQAVAPGVAYSYNYTPPSKDTLNFKVKMQLYEQKVHKRKTLTLITFIGGLTGGGFDGLAWFLFSDYKKKYLTTRTNFNELSKKMDSWRTTAIIAAPCAGTALLTSLLLFVIPVGGAPDVEDKKAVGMEWYSTPYRSGVVFNLQIPSPRKRPPDLARRLKPL
jgi:hypothetical protein